MWQPTGRPLATLDIETFHDYFLVMFSKINPKGELIKWKGFELYKGHPLAIREIIAVLKRHTVVTFNGNGYDIPILMYALTGVSNSALKRASDHIIQGNLRSWQFEQEYGVSVHPSVDHIDLMEVIAGQASLKIYGGRVHSKRMQDLPYHHDDHIFTDVDPGLFDDEEVIAAYRSSVRRKTTFDYCGNDHATTQDLYWAVKTDLDTREAMSIQYGLDLRSKSDAQIAEAVIKVEIERRTGKRVWKPDESTKNKAFRYTAPKFVQFSTPDMQRIKRIVENTLFVVNNGKLPMPESLENLQITLGDSTYQMGIGGLHSTESVRSYVTDDENEVSEIDVRSYYPSIIIECGLFPKHLGPVFLEVYTPIYNERQVSTGQKKQTFKIILNGSFGKFNNQYSILFSPELLIQITITGQLCLLMLIEQFEEEGIPVVSANTDGVVTNCPRYLIKRRDQIVREWEKSTGFIMESNVYKAIYSRDVNNYIAITAKGEVKRKGAYAKPGLAKNPAANIVNEAVVKYLTDGVPVEETIMWHEDIRDFVGIKKVDGGGIQGGEQLIDDWVRRDPRHWVRQAWIDSGANEVWLENKKVKLVTKRPPPVTVSVEPAHLGKAVRFYYSTNSPGPIRRAKTGAIVADTTGSLALMELPEHLPTDLDYDWYIDRANRVLKEIAAHV